MHTTRSTYLLRRMVGLAAVPALLLTAAACGDDDDSAGGGASFCDAANDMNDRFDTIDDPTSDEFGEALDAIRSLDPPAEIAEDWETMVGAFENLSDVDLEDPEALANLDIGELEAASERVSTYMEEECGITSE
jgi:hypothetical protein